MTLYISHQSINKKCVDEIQSKQNLIVFEDLKEVMKTVQTLWWKKDIEE